MKKTIKITALFLAACLIFLINSTFISAFSAEEKTAGVSETVKSTETDQIKTTILPLIKEEDTTRRDRFTKHFLCDDGSYIAAVYPNAVHEMIDGEWVESKGYSSSEDGFIHNQDIFLPVDSSKSNTKVFSMKNEDKSISWDLFAEYDKSGLVELKKEGSVKEVANSFSEEFEKLQTSFETLSSQKAEVQQAISVEKAELYRNYSDFSDGTRTSSSITETVKEKEKVVKGNIEKLTNEFNNKVKNYNNSIINANRGLDQNIVVEYENAFSKSSRVKYTAGEGFIKEDVILDSYDGFISYSVKLSSEGLKPIKQKSGEVSFYDDAGNEVFAIGRPYMYDSDNNDSYDIDVKVDLNGDNYIITYTPDPEWLKSSDRAYPVVIDPIYVNCLHFSVNQNFVSSTKADNVYKWINYKYMYVGDTGSFGETYTFISYSSLPSMLGKIVTTSFIDMYFSSDTNARASISAFIPSYNWDPSTLTWSNKPQCDLVVEESVPSFYSSDSDIYYSDILLGALPSQWYGSDQRAKQFGIMLTLNYTESSVYNKYYSFNSSNTNGSDPGLTPMLSIYYVDAPDNSYSSEVNIPDGYYYINNYATGSSLTQNIHNGTVFVSQFNRSEIQKWYVTRLNDGSYTISPKSYMNMRVEVHCGQYIHYRPITVYDYTTPNNLSSPHIKFRFYSDVDGTINIRPVSSTDYSLCVYPDYNDNMWYYNQYTNTYREFARDRDSFVQLHLYDSDNIYEKWKIVPVSNEIVRNPYYSIYTPNSFNESGNPTAYSLQKRMNCYGYAFGFISNVIDPLPIEGGDKQQPGFLANSSDEYAQYVVPITFSDDDKDQDDILEDLVNNFTLDMELLEYSVEEYLPTGDVVEQFGTNLRLIAVVVGEEDYHFYMQHSDGTWSHKPGSYQVTNKSFVSDVCITNYNIMSVANEGPYLGSATNPQNVRFFKITKPAVWDYALDFEPVWAYYYYNGVYIGPIYTVKDSIYNLNDYVTAGDNAETSVKIQILDEKTGLFDHRLDHDVFYFTASNSGTYTVSIVGDSDSNISYKVFDQFRYETISNTTYNSTSFNVSMVSGDTIYIDLSEVNGLYCSYSISIT